MVASQHHEKLVKRTVDVLAGRSTLTLLNTSESMLSYLNSTRVPLD